jgi:hypothetical protein
MRREKTTAKATKKGEERSDKTDCKHDFVALQRTGLVLRKGWRLLPRLGATANRARTEQKEEMKRKAK